MADGVGFGFPLDHNTEQWGHKQVGPVGYVVSPEHTFSAVLAQQRAADIERLARFFELPSFPITLYSCTDPTELFRIRGYQQHPLKHLYPTCGRAEGEDIVFKALSSGLEPWPVLAEYRITRETLRSGLVKELALDPLIIP